MSGKKSWAAGDEDVRVFDGMEKAGLLEAKKMPDQLLLKVKKGTKDPDTYSWRQDLEKRWVIERWLFNFIGVYGVIERRELCRLCRKTGNDSLGTEEEFEECAKRMEKCGFFTSLKTRLGKEQMKMCFMCKGDLKESTTTYMTDFNGSYIIIKNVPCTQCTQCGEVYLNGATLMKIEKILERLKSALTEIAVVDYTQLAA